jgi:hypothetical protein
MFYVTLVMRPEHTHPDSTGEETEQYDTIAEAMAEAQAAVLTRVVLEYAEVGRFHPEIGKPGMLYGVYSVDQDGYLSCRNRF